MRLPRIVRSVVGLLGMLAVPGLCQAQTGTPAANVSSVVRGGVVTVSYDLISNDQNAQFTVELEVSSDGGKTYAIRPRTLKGDVGPAVRAGMGKQITWEAARDIENLEVDRYRYRVTATPARGQTPAPKPAQTPAVSTVQTPPPGPSTGVGVQPRSGNGAKWAGIVLMGAGGALAVMGQSVLKKEVCDEFDCWKEKNTALLWAGIGVAGGGVALLAIGSSRNNAGTEIVFRRGGVVIQHRLPLPH